MQLFRRHPGGPILSARDLPYRANAVFNAGAATLGAETLLLLRVEDCRGRSHLTVARSADGVQGWRVEPAPSLAPDPVAHPEEAWGVEDPRLTYVEKTGAWIIAYTAYSQRGPLVALATTHDFRGYTRLGIVLPPENKDAALFPVRFQGRYAMLHRPGRSAGANRADIWIAYSPDLEHWGRHRRVLSARGPGWWDAEKIGAGPPPLATPEGWLLLYHGVRRIAGQDSYRLGLALLDLDDPGRVIRRGEEWVFAPQAPFERSGDVGNVVFPCGWTRDGDQLRLYYGAADSVLALATASLGELVEWLLREARS